MKATPRGAFPPGIADQVNRAAQNANQNEERLQKLERQAVARAAEKVKRASYEPSANLTTKEHEVLASIVQSSLKMTDIFFDVSKDDRQKLLDKLNRISK